MRVIIVLFLVTLAVSSCHVTTAPVTLISTVRTAILNGPLCEALVLFDNIILQEPTDPEISKNTLSLLTRSIDELAMDRLALVDWRYDNRMTWVGGDPKIYMDAITPRYPEFYCPLFSTLLEVGLNVSHQAVPVMHNITCATRTMTGWSVATLSITAEQLRRDVSFTCVTTFAYLRLLPTFRVHLVTRF